MLVFSVVFMLLPLVPSLLTLLMLLLPLLPQLQLLLLPLPLLPVRLFSPPSSLTLATLSPTVWTKLLYMLLVSYILPHKPYSQNLTS